ncbi:MAG: phage tail tape measure protein [Ruminococcus sp.]|nr:phage tail tape measure protein [Ruminococcus sp.]
MSFDGTLKFDTAIDLGGFKSGIDALGNIAQQGVSLITSTFSAAGSVVSDLGKFSVGVGKDFEAGMSQVAATLGYSSEALKKPFNEMSVEEKQTYDNMESLSAKAKEMGAATSFSASQASEGLNILAMSGYSAEESIGMIENVLHLAEAGNFADVTEASAYYSDMIAKGATLAATDVTQLGTALSQASASADSYGQSSTEASVALLRLAEQNVTGSAAATALAASMKDLYSPTDSAKKALESLGVSAYDSSGKARNFNTVIDELNGALGSLSDEERASLEDTIFGIQGKDAFDKMVASSGETVQKFYSGIADASGSAALQSETMLDNLEGKMTIFQSASEGFGIAIYESIKEPLKDLVVTGTGYVEQLTKAFNEGGFDGLAKTFGDVLADGVKVISGYIPKITSLAVSAVKSFVDGISKNADSISETLFEVGTTIFSGFSEIIPEIITLGADILCSLLDGFSEALPDLADTAVSAVSKLASALMNGSSKIFETGTKIISELATAIVQKLPEISEIAVSMVTSFADMINQNLPQLIDAGFQIIVAVGTAIFNALPTLVESAISVIRTFCESLLTGENVDQLLTAGYEVLEILTQTILDNLPELIEIAVQIIEFLCTEILADGNIAELIETAVDIVLALANAVIDHLDEILIAA